MTDLVDQMFPPIHRKWTPEYTDFNYWKAPVAEFPLPDFSPPSPALSARSDTSGRSTLARIRNFSLVGGGRQAASIRQSALARVNGSASRETSPPPGETQRSADLRQMSSFERLSNTLSFGVSADGNSRRSLSPASRSSSSQTYADSEDEEGDEELSEEGEKRERRRRRRSMTSMPGSLHDDEEEVRFDDDEEGREHDGGGEYDEEGQQGMDDEEETFDEDLEMMKKVPFL
jgi:phosphatidate phosphatase LPIN